MLLFKCGSLAKFIEELESDELLVSKGGLFVANEFGSSRSYCRFADLTDFEDLNIYSI